ncbi:unnamed protein product [Vicia faba]|uniref:Retroviral polymerase SH3-like domain-containing protein n=1 Tax=Vicia faba TaxID=3906 RepID=A0AAV0ZAA8_VICFA|nr:unnamed protein product [Vicia faba]
MSQHAYYCLEPLSNRIYVSRHVNFVENSFPYQSIINSSSTCHLIPSPDSTVHSIIHINQDQSSAPVLNQSLVHESSMYVSPVLPLTVFSHAPAIVLNQTRVPLSYVPSCTPTYESLVLLSSPIPVHASNTTPLPESMLPIESSVTTKIPVISDNLTRSTTNNSHDQVQPSQTNNSVQRDPIVTRSQNNIFKPKNLFTATKHELQENLEPSTITQAFKIPHWRDVCSANLMHS